MTVPTVKPTELGEPRLERLAGTNPRWLGTPVYAAGSDPPHRPVFHEFGGRGSGGTLRWETPTSSSARHRRAAGLYGSSKNPPPPAIGFRDDTIDRWPISPRSLRTSSRTPLP